MVTSIARQSIIIKCNMQASVLLGNYEFYYAAGLFCKLAGMDAPKQEIRPKELQEWIEKGFGEFQGKDEKEKYLLKLLQGYKVLEDYDGQMEELLKMGFTEEHLWEVNIS